MPLNQVNRIDHTPSLELYLDCFGKLEHDFL